MDQIVIHELEVFYRVGVPEAERANPQRLLVSLQMGHDFTPAAESEDLSDTLDYAAICEWLLRLGDGRCWKLIETLAVDIAREIQVKFGARSVTVGVKKFSIPQARWVAVRVTRPDAINREIS